MESEAKKKRHCTVGEAISVGMHMCANSIVLTHFSQRYPRVPVLPSEISSRIAIAFDYMKLKFSWMNRFPVQNLEQLKQKEKEEIEEKTKAAALLKKAKPNAKPALKRKVVELGNSEPSPVDVESLPPASKKQKSNLSK